MVMDKFEENDDQRQCYRHPSHVPVSINSNSFGPDDLCSLRDISLGGMAFRSGNELKMGETVRATLPDLAPAFEVKGTVVWSRRVNGGFEVGVEFTESGNRPEIVEKIVEEVAHLETCRLAAA